MADVVALLSGWSTTVGTNLPTSATTIGSGLAGNFQQIQATVRTELATRSTGLTATATTDLGTKAEGTVLVTQAAGTIVCTSFGTISAGMKKLVTFSVSGGSLTLTHNATSLILPGSANVTVADGDTLYTESLGSGNWKIHAYYRQDGSSLAGVTVDTNPIVKGSVDATKLVRLEVDGITTATTRVLTVPDKDITIAGISDLAQLRPVTASVAASALTATLNPTTIDFRSATLGSGTVNSRSVAAAVSVVVPPSATLGTVSAVLSRIALLAIDNAGTVETAVVNMSGLNNLDESTLISTTAISAAATSSSVIYSTTARSNVPFRIIGYIESTQATAGTWATAPSLIQGAGSVSTNRVSLGIASFYETPQQTITAGGGLTIAHGLGKSPKRVDAFLQCVVNDNGFVVGQELPINPGPNGASVNRGQAITYDATNLYVRYGSAAIVYEGMNNTSGVSVGYANASWRLVIRAWA